MNAPTRSQGHFLPLANVISILFLRNDFEEGEDYFLAKYRVPWRRAEDEETATSLSETEEGRRQSSSRQEIEHDQQDSSSESEVESEEDETLLQPRTAETDPYSPLRRHRPTPWTPQHAPSASETQSNAALSQTASTNGHRAFFHSTDQANDEPSERTTRSPSEGLFPHEVWIASY